MKTAKRVYIKIQNQQHLKFLINYALSANIRVEEGTAKMSFNISVFPYFVWEDDRFTANSFLEANLVKMSTEEFMTFCDLYSDSLEIDKDCFAHIDFENKIVKINDSYEIPFEKINDLYKLIN